MFGVPGGRRSTGPAGVPQGHAARQGAEDLVAGCERTGAGHGHAGAEGRAERADAPGRADPFLACAVTCSFSRCTEAPLNGHNNLGEKNTSEWVFYRPPGPPRFGPGCGLREVPLPQLRPGGIATQLREARPAGRDREKACPGRVRGGPWAARAPSCPPGGRRRGRRAVGRPAAGAADRKAYPARCFQAEMAAPLPRPSAPAVFAVPLHGRVAPVVARRFRPARGRAGDGDREDTAMLVL